MGVGHFNSGHSHSTGNVRRIYRIGLEDLAHFTTKAEIESYVRGRLAGQGFDLSKPITGIAHDGSPNILGYIEYRQTLQDVVFAKNPVAPAPDMQIEPAWYPTVEASNAAQELATIKWAASPGAEFFTHSIVTPDNSMVYGYDPEKGGYFWATPNIGSGQAVYYKRTNICPNCASRSDSVCVCPAPVAEPEVPAAPKQKRHIEFAGE